MLGDEIGQKKMQRIVNRDIQADDQQGSKTIF